MTVNEEMDVVCCASTRVCNEVIGNNEQERMKDTKLWESLALVRNYSKWLGWESQAKTLEKALKRLLLTIARLLYSLCLLSLSDPNGELLSFIELHGIASPFLSYFRLFHSLKRLR